MWWLLVSLIWWCGTSAIPSPGTTTVSPPNISIFSTLPIASQPPVIRVANSSSDNISDDWICPEIARQPIVECSCDMPHTLRCTGDKTAMKIIGDKLRTLKSAYVSLLDCTIQNVSSIKEPLLEGVTLHGLVVSSGEINQVNFDAFKSLGAPLQALGLPNNELKFVPTEALESLPELDRLDLSGNKLQTLDSSSFKGLKNLSFVDLSDNEITKIAADTFNNIPQLRILRLRGNRLTLQVVSKLTSISKVEEFDLSGNNLLGPLDPKAFPKLNSLKDLQLSHNSLTSVKFGAFQGFPNLTSLFLHHNQIDVLEDHAFLNMDKLSVLDLSHNRIVAVSGASLAHLIKLNELDLRHNFLRALTPDLVLPLLKLKTLKLDDNDISIIASDALRGNNSLKHLTLSENPLNCDCSLIEFFKWLKGDASISRQDKATAVCTTPPSLENAVLVDLTLNMLVCSDDETQLDSVKSPLLSMPVVKSRINFKRFEYDGVNIKLEWKVDTTSYTCDAIFVYEEEDLNEVLVESNPIKCDSDELQDPTDLSVFLPVAGLNLQNEHKYRYCVVLFESEDADDVSLILGCSDVIPLVRNNKIIVQHDQYGLSFNSKVVAIQANLTNHGSLSIKVNVYPLVEPEAAPPPSCEINVAILEQNALLSQRKLDCVDPEYVFVGLNNGPYRVCANVLKQDLLLVQKPKCVTVFKKEAKGFSTLDVVFVTIFLILCFMVVALIWGVRKILLKPKLQTHQCFMPPENEDQQHQHNRYVKLQATTKL